VLSVDSGARGGVYGRGIAKFRNSDHYPIPTLTESAIKGAKPAERPYKLFDERGLFLLVTRAGGGLWRFRYRMGGVEKLLTLGAYPDASLKRAREKRDEARRAVADGIDPGAKRRAERDAITNTFAAVADEWLLTRKASLTESTWERGRQQVHKWVITYLGNKPIASLEAPDLLEVLKRIEAKGVIDTAHRTREVCERIFRYAIATGRAKHDIAADLVGALAPRTKQPTDTQRVFTLRHVYGFTQHQIAVFLHMSADVVTAHLVKAVHAIADAADGALSRTPSEPESLLTP
jgi:hypothetical protein